MTFNFRLCCWSLFCVIVVVTGMPQQSVTRPEADCRRISESTTLKDSDQTAFHLTSSENASSFALCYNIDIESVTEIALKDNFLHCEYMLEPYSGNGCEVSDRKDYEYPLNQEYPTLVLNERNVVCSYQLGRTPASGTRTLVSFEYDGGKAPQVNQHDSSELRQCFPVGTLEYPCGVVRKVNVSSSLGDNSGDFVRLFAGDECEDDTILEKRSGSPQFYYESDLAAVVQLSPDEEVRSFNVVLYFTK